MSDKKETQGWKEYHYYQGMSGQIVLWEEKEAESMGLKRPPAEKIVAYLEDKHTRAQNKEEGPSRISRGSKTSIYTVARQGWTGVNGTWTKAEAFLKAQVSKGLKSKKVDTEAKGLRKLSCHGNLSLNIGPCELRRKSRLEEGNFFCGACGCGDVSRALLAGEEDRYTKLDYPYLECPLQMPGFSNYVTWDQEKTEHQEVMVRKQEIEKQTGGESSSTFPKVLDSNGE